MLRRSLLAILLALSTLATLGSSEDALPPIPPIARLLPPEGVKLPEEEQAKLDERLTAMEKKLASRQDDPLLPDVEIFTKAVRYALDLHEFYDAKKDIAKAHRLLDEAEKRLAGASPEGHFVVRGYRSEIDGSVQPYGIVFPKGYDPQQSKSYPIFVWLHGRGDQATDLHFINERMTQIGPLGPVEAVVVHAFGRQCVGFKSAGEIDVIDALFAYQQQYKVRPSPTFTALAGFSMGGAGAWHVGAHYGRYFGVVSPGAGFAETAAYTNTNPDSVPWYERKLWGCYDVPCYTRNLFNLPVIAYSGENDKQMQAARVMEQAFAQEGRTLKHLIGPGVGHKYEPKTRDELIRLLTDMTAASPDISGNAPIAVQTRTLRYNQTAANFHSCTAELLGLERHWDEARLDAQNHSAGATSTCVVTTKNVTAFRLGMGAEQFKIDGQELSLAKRAQTASFERVDGQWHAVEQFRAGLLKRPGLQGPIDDVFLTPFLVVAPSGNAQQPLVQRWVEFELAHFVARWKALMRGEVRIKKDSEVTDDDIARYSLVCFGDPASNSIIRRTSEKLPVTWKEGRIAAGRESFSSASHLPALIYPNPLAPEKYLVINSGLTFREAHDKTNSQQNPKLPDWAVIDLTQLPDDKAPGRIAAAGFFDEEWQWQEQMGD